MTSGAFCRPVSAPASACICELENGRLAEARSGAQLGMLVWGGPTLTSKARPLQVLKPGGRDEAVTSDNRLQFVHLAAEWHLARRLGQPAEAFAQGLHEARVALCRVATCRTRSVRTVLEASASRKHRRQVETVIR